MNKSDQNIRGVVFDIKKYALHDGPGIRTTVFLMGCPLRCWWCHNPEGLGEHAEFIKYDERKFTNRASCGQAGAGQIMTAGDVAREVLSDRLFYEESEGGVTFSGGEPLTQPRFVRALSNLLRAEGVHTVLDTSGYAERSKLETVLDGIDLFLYDLKLMDDAAHREYTGVSNVPILENLRYLDRAGKDIAIRLPLVPRMTDRPANIEATAAMIRSLDHVSALYLLPYHRMAEAKYRRMDRDSPMEPVDPPSDDRLNEIRDYFESQGIRTHIGG